MVNPVRPDLSNPGFKVWTGEKISPADSKKRQDALVIDVSKIYNGGKPLFEPGFAKPSALASNTVQGAASIVELARALKNNPQLMYQFVHDNISWQAYWGLKKGALGCLQDGSGNSFDQSALLIALLRQAGFTASYVLGSIELTVAQYNNWFGTSGTDGMAAAAYAAAAYIPETLITGGSAPILQIGHVWVQCTISGTVYTFDPAVKAQNWTAPVANLGTILGYNSSTFLSDAESGATVDPSGNFVQHMNRTNIRNDLTTYSNNLATWIKANNPSASLDQIIGGAAIIPATIPLLQTSLPYETPGETPTVWTADVPLSYKSTYEFSWSAASIDQTFTTDQLANARLVLFFSGNVPSLYLNGVAVGPAGTAQPANTFGYGTVKITHNATMATSSLSMPIYTGSPILAAVGMGRLGRGQADYHQRQLAANVASGAAVTSESVIGESLAFIWSMYNAELSAISEIIDKLSGNFTFTMDVIGGVLENSAGPTMNVLVDPSYEGGAPASVFADLSAQLLHGSALEASILQQALGIVAVSTPVVIDAANTAGDDIYKGTPSNWSGTVQPALVANGYTTAELSQPNALISATPIPYNLLITGKPLYTIGSYQWQGFYALATSGGGGQGIITQYTGGGPASNVTAAALEAGVSTNALSPLFGQAALSTFLDPIDAFAGNFTYSRSDIQVGSQGFPYGLSFQRFYNSFNRYQSNGLGKGWTHNYNISARLSSDGLIAMGSQYALQAVATIASLFVTLDLLSDTTQPVAKLTTYALGAKWWIDQISNNTVVITMPDSIQVYALQPDGSYSPPLNNANTLSLSGGLYTLTTPQKVKMTFNASGQITGWTFPSGAAVACNYTSGVLTSITVLGRTLTLGYTSGALTSVTDGSRTVNYTYDINGNLMKFTDTNSQAFIYQYDQPGRMTKYFKPANSTTAFATNVYDTLSRVMTQADALGHTWTYFFAGSRGEEDDPLGNARVRYFNRNGAVVRDIDAAGNETDYAYDGLNRLTQSILPEGNQKLYTYDSNNNVLSLTAVAKPGSGLANIVNSFTYDPTWALVKTATDGKSQVTTYNYDPTLGNLLTIQRPVISGMTPTVTFTYNARGQVLTATDETGVVTQNTYSTTNETLTKQIVDYNVGTGHLNLTTQFGYNTAGDTNSVTDPNTNITTSMYDTERRLTQVTAPTPFSYLTTRAYDANSNLLNVQQQTGASPAYQITTWTYSVTDKKLTVTDPANDVTTFAYDGKDRLASVTDAMNRQTQYSYDVRDNNYQTTDATGTISDTRLYTSNNLLASVQDARSSLTQYNYDGFDRPNQTIYADTTYEQNVSYDANSNVLIARTRAANQIVNTFDVLNRLSTKAPASQPTVTFGYDLAGRLLSATKPTVSGDPSSGAFSKLYDTAGRFYQESYPDGKQVAFGLDSNGNVTKLTYPDGYYVTRSYDALNRLGNIFLNGATTAAATLAYDELSRRTSLTYNNGATVGYSYASPVINDLTNIVHNFVGSNVAFGYGYNQDHEITGQSVTDGSYQWQPTVGSVAYAAANSVNEYPSVGGTAYSYNGDGCLTGNGVWTFGYDTEDHLTSASKTGTSVAYVYDGFHRQAQKSVTTGSTTKSRYLYSGWQRIADYDGVAGTLQNRYIYTDGLDEPLMQVTSAGVVTYYHANAQGSVIGVSNSAGAVTSKNLYGTFGETATLSGTTFGFTGQRYDSDTGLYYYKNRYYSPVIGRFLQTDPAGYVDGLNLYTYGGNNPITFADPFGLVADGIGGGSGASGSGGGEGGPNLYKLGATIFGPGLQNFSNPLFAAAALGGAFFGGALAIAEIEGIVLASTTSALARIVALNAGVNAARFTSGAYILQAAFRQPVSGTFQVQGGVATANIGQIVTVGRIPFRSAIASLISAAKAQGANQLVVNAQEVVDPGLQRFLLNLPTSSAGRVTAELTRDSGNEIDVTLTLSKLLTKLMVRQ